MRPQAAALQGALAVAGLVAAYATWQRAPEVASGDVVVIDGAKASLEKLRHEKAGRWVELTRGTGPGEASVWVRQGSSPPPAEADAGAPLDQAGASDGGGPPADGGLRPDGGAPDAGPGLRVASPFLVPPGKERELRGNDRAEKLVERFMPLRAARALGVLPPDKRKELGLEGSLQRLEIVAAGATRAFRVGNPVGGLGTPYLEDERDQKVYLFAGSLLTELDPASQQLVDRRLHAFKSSEADDFVVKAEGQEREFVQTGGDSPQTQKVAPKATPDKPDDLARNWHDKVWTRLIATEVLGRGELPATGEPAVALRIDYSAKGKPQGWLEVGRGKGNDLWARTEHTASWVLLAAGADELLGEAKKVLGAP